MVAQEPDAINIYGDIFGRSQEEHDKALSDVLQLWRENGLTLSLKKSKFNLTSVKFDKVFKGEGVSPDPEKVEASHVAGPAESTAEVG